MHTAHTAEQQLIVAFTDLTFFTKYSNSGASWLEVFETMSEYFEFIGSIVDDHGGRLVKCIGDSSLLTFPEERADDAVTALNIIKERGDEWFESRGIPCRHRIKAHFGLVVTGLIGAHGNKQPDVYGETVNTAATMQSNGIAVSPQVFRLLSPAARKLFKKHTPPVTYIPVNEPHRNR